MPKVGMQPIRRRQLIDATVASIHEDGFANTTIAGVSRRAGLSSGIVAHYFDDKAGLLEATMRKLAEDLRRQLLERLAHADGPEARLRAVIDANLADAQFTPEIMSAWLSFWGQVRHSPPLARVQKVYRQRMMSDLLHAAKQVLPPQSARRLAAGLAAMIDGLWMQRALAGKRADPREARALAHAYLATQLAARIKPVDAEASDTDAPYNG